MQACIAFVFATFMEAGPFTAAINAKQISTDPWIIYQSNLLGQPCIVVISGMGMESAKNATNFVIENYSVRMIYNCGVAGSLIDTFRVGDIVNITDSRLLRTGVIHKDVCRLSAQSHSLTEYLDGMLLTVDEPVFDPVQKKTLSVSNQLVDMEGGIIARICEMNNVPCQLLKIISDNATKRKQLKKNLSMVSEKLAVSITTNISRIFNQEMIA